MIMGKATTRRQRSRRAFLARLAAENPDRFQCEWNKRVNSWCRLAKVRAGNSFDSEGRAVPAAFDVIEMALRELAECGEMAFALAADGTRDILVDACCTAVAQAMDRRLYHLSRAHKLIYNSIYKVRR